MDASFISPLARLRFYSIIRNVITQRKVIQKPKLDGILLNMVKYFGTYLVPSHKLPSYLVSPAVEERLHPFLELRCPRQVGRGNGLRGH